MHREATQDEFSWGKGGKFSALVPRGRSGSFLGVEKKYMALPGMRLSPLPPLKSRNLWQVMVRSTLSVREYTSTLALMLICHVAQVHGFGGEREGAAGEAHDPAGAAHGVNGVYGQRLLHQHQEGPHGGDVHAGAWRSLCFVLCQHCYTRFSISVANERG